LEARQAEDSVRFLLEVADKIGRRPILMATNDHAALFVADHAAALSHSYLFAGQSALRSNALITKLSLFDLATKHQIPTPSTFAPTSLTDVQTFARITGFPVMLKQNACGNRNGFRNNFVVHDEKQLLSRCVSLRWGSDHNMLMQEFIPGGDDCIWMFNGYFDQNSQCLFGVTGKKIRQCPIHTGPSCLAVCIHNQTVYDLTLRLMKAIGYEGILDIGYRYDARDGKYKVLDVNPRIGATFRLFVAENGMDVARAQYLHLTGQKVPFSAVSEGRKWIVEDWDLLSSFRYYHGGELTVSEWIRSFAHIEEAAFLSLTDPLPVLGALIVDIRQLAERLGRRKTNKAQPAIKAAAPEPMNGSSVRG
jgi:D-aspartate ligase